VGGGCRVPCLPPDHVPGLRVSPHRHGLTAKGPKGSKPPVVPSLPFLADRPVVAGGQPSSVPVAAGVTGSRRMHGGVGPSSHHPSVSGRQQVPPVRHPLRVWPTISGFPGPFPFPGPDDRARFGDPDRLSASRIRLDPARISFHPKASLGRHPGGCPPAPTACAVSAPFLFRGRLSAVWGPCGTRTLSADRVPLEDTLLRRLALRPRLPVPHCWGLFLFGEGVRWLGADAGSRASPRITFRAHPAFPGGHGLTAKGPKGGKPPLVPSLPSLAGRPLNTWRPTVRVPVDHEGHREAADARRCRTVVRFTHRFLVDPRADPLPTIAGLANRFRLPGPVSGSWSR
jgi:hypothetical protein